MVGGAFGYGNPSAEQTLLGTTYSPQTKYRHGMQLGPHFSPIPLLDVGAERVESAAISDGLG